jgi:uncharacterized damage-inducible protein DinB
MSISLADQYRRWFAYERDCHARVIAAFRAVPADRQTAPGYQRAVDLLAHVVAARQLWLFRFEAIPEGPAELFPSGVSLERLEADRANMEAGWEAYLAALNDEELRRVLTYRSLEGPRFRNRIEDILTQLFGHAWYHRGQIALLLRQMDVDPPATDFVFWTREPVADTEP